MLKCQLFVIAWLIQSCALQQNNRGNKRFCSDFGDIGFRCLKNCDQSYLISVLEADISAQKRSEIAAGRKAECENKNQKCCLLDISLDKCGQRNQGYDSIKGGEDSGLAEKGEWPHVCMVVEYYPNGTSQYRHPASLVGPNVLISGGSRYSVGEDAADNLGSYRIRCGTWRREENPEESDYQEVEIEKVIEHPEFDRNNRHNDYSIILTKTKFLYTNSILPVCLPSENQDLSFYTDCYAMGWGVKELYATELSEIMKSMRVQLVDRDTCQEELKKSKLTNFFILHKNFICGKIEEDYNSCKGDGGGPLVCRHPDSGRYVQIGIISWGVDCGHQFYPDAYSYLPPVVCWILKEIISYNQENFGSYELFGGNDLQKQNCRK